MCTNNIYAQIRLFILNRGNYVDVNLPDAMSRATTYVVYPHVFGAWTHWNAIVSASDCASTDGNTGWVLHMNAIRIWASTRGYDSDVFEPDVSALPNGNMNCLAV